MLKKMIDDELLTFAHDKALERLLDAEARDATSEASAWWSCCRTLRRFLETPHAPETWRPSPSTR